MKSKVITTVVLCLALTGGAMLYFGHHASNRAIDILVSSRSSYQERQAVWKQLQDAGGLDQAVPRRPGA